MAISSVYTQQEYSGGLNTAYESWQIADNELPSSRNMEISKKGSIGSGYGYKSAGAGSSGILGLFSFYPVSGTKKMMRIYGTTVEATTDPLVATPTWSAVETLGAAGDRFAAVQYDDKLWYGDGTNDFRSWTGSAITTYGSAPKGNIMAVWRSQCWIAGNSTNPSTLYYSVVDDFTTWAGTTSGSITVNKKDGEKIRGIVPLGDYLIVFKERSIWKVAYEYDDVTSTNFYSVTQVGYHGCLGPRSAVLVNNDAVALSTYGVISVGQEANYSGLRTNMLSSNIRPDLASRTFGGAVNETYANLSCGAFYEDKFYLSVPIDDSTSPNGIYLYDSLYSSWMFRYGIGANIFCTWRASEMKDYLFFGGNDGGVYYFDLVHNFNGTNYEKSFMTKRNNLGNPGVKKEIGMITITGTKSLGSTIEGTFYQDYASEEFTITDSDLIQDSGGGYIGENYFGDNYFGGTGVSDGVPQYRYRKRFTPNERTCYEMQLKFFNDTADEPYSVDSIQVAFDTLDLQEL